MITSFSKTQPHVRGRVAGVSKVYVIYKPRHPFENKKQAPIMCYQIGYHGFADDEGRTSVGYLRPSNEIETNTK